MHHLLFFTFVGLKCADKHRTGFTVSGSEQARLRSFYKQFFVAVIMILMLFLLPICNPVSAQELPGSVNIIKDVIVQNASGETVSTVWNRQSVIVNIYWDANAISELKAGDYLEVRVPAELRFPTDDQHANFEIYADGQIPAGKVTVVNGTETKPGTIRLIFYSFVEGKNNLKGTLRLAARVSASKGQQGNVSCFYLQTDFEQSYSLDIITDLIDFTKETIVKWPERIEGEQTMNWNVLIVLSGSATKDVTVLDSIADGVVAYKPDSFYLVPADFDEFGNIVKEYPQVIRHLVAGTELDFNQNLTSFTARLGDLTHLTYVLRYQTTFNPNVTIYNNVQMKAINNIELADESGYEQLVDSGGNISGDGRGYLKIVKQEKDKPEIKIAGAVFKITNLQDLSSFTLETQEPNGDVISAALVPGQYRIEEVSVPAGYLKDAAVFTIMVNGGETTVQTILNSKTPDIPETGFPVVLYP